MIQILDGKTIDKIAAGEVVERPSSVIKELLENAIDAGADAVSVEIKKGGTEYIRVTDNGSGIDRNEVRMAFLPHATSKLRKIEDLYSLTSLGFRGEALSSIASVSRVELLTKTADDPIGIRYVIEGGSEVSFEEAGTPDGTTFIIKDLFYNTPARRKFLKSESTEAGYITSLVEEIALSRPDISVKYTVNGRNTLVTRGNNDLKEVVYRIYGKYMADSLISVNEASAGMTLSGFISKPVVSRNSRSMENYFVNSRYVKDDTVSRAIEDGYSGFLMQKKFPFTVLKLSLPSDRVDINVHPRKMEVRFSDQLSVYDFIRDSVRKSLSGKEFINDFSFGPEDKTVKTPEPSIKIGEPFERENKPHSVPEPDPAPAPDPAPGSDPSRDKYPAPDAFTVAGSGRVFREETVYGTLSDSRSEQSTKSAGEASGRNNTDYELREKSPAFSPAVDDPGNEITGIQGDLFEEKILSKDASMEYRIVGQIFNTYWIIEYRDEMLLIDQHAAHEKVNFERFMKEFKERSVTTQNLFPPIILTLDGAHRDVLLRFLDRFTEMGFEIEPFGGNDFAVRTVPYNLYGLNDNEVLTALLDELSEGRKDEDISVIYDKIASMSCKSAVKGGNMMSFDEAKALIEELLTLKDPYTCPHGRPTIIKMSKHEMEKKFKRIV